MKNLLLLLFLFVTIQCFAQDDMIVGPRTSPSDRVNLELVTNHSNYQQGTRLAGTGLLLIALGSAVAFLGPELMDKPSLNSSASLSAQQQYYSQLSNYTDNVHTVQLVGGGVITLGGFISMAGVFKMGKQYHQKQQP